jgi:hypothetical protein
VAILYHIFAAEHGVVSLDAAGVKGSQPLTSRVSVTSGTALSDFDAVKGVLSDKPL